MKSMSFPPVRIFTRNDALELFSSFRFLFYCSIFQRNKSGFYDFFGAEAGPQRSHWAPRTPRDTGEGRH